MMGKRIPTYRFTKVEFGKDTPYATIVESADAQSPPGAACRKLPRCQRQTLGKVVSEGTARRLSNSFPQRDGSPLVIGGKTGTGDNRIITSSGHKTSGRALNRTATFVFYLGDNHFGTLTAFVNGRSAGALSFTSALPSPGTERDGSGIAALYQWIQPKSTLGACRRKPF